MSSPPKSRPDGQKGYLSTTYSTYNGSNEDIEPAMNEQSFEKGHVSSCCAGASLRSNTNGLILVFGKLCSMRPYSEEHLTLPWILDWICPFDQAFKIGISFGMM
jgi:hypothetical protein